MRLQSTQPLIQWEDKITIEKKAASQPLPLMQWAKEQQSKYIAISTTNQLYNANMDYKITIIIVQTRRQGQPLPLRVREFN